VQDGQVIGIFIIDCFAALRNARAVYVVGSAGRPRDCTNTTDIHYVIPQARFSSERHAFEAGNLAGDRLAFYATTLPALA
jgi:hypothetical protein